MGKSSLWQEINRMINNIDNFGYADIFIGKHKRIGNIG